MPVEMRAANSRNQSKEGKQTLGNTQTLNGALPETVAVRLRRAANIVMSLYADDRTVRRQLWWDVNRYSDNESNRLFVACARELHDGQQLFREGLLFSFLSAEARRFAYDHCANAYVYWATISGAIEAGASLPLSRESFAAAYSQTAVNA